MNTHNKWLALVLLLGQTFIVYAGGGHSKSHETNIIKAARKGKLAEVIRLVENEGAGVDTTDMKEKTALMRAVTRSHFPVVLELIRLKADVNAQDLLGNTALHRAAWTGNLPIVQELLKAGADVSTKNNDGYTALHNAFTWCFQKIGEALLEAGADINAKTNSGYTPFSLVYSKCGNYMAYQIKRWSIDKRVKITDPWDVSRLNWLYIGEGSCKDNYDNEYEANTKRIEKLAQQGNNA